MKNSEHTPQASPLDSPSAIKKIDEGNMARIIADLPGQIKKCWKEINAMELPADYANFSNVIIAGMGGSGIGGDLVSEVLPSDKLVPITSLHDYDIPAYVDSSTLFIAVSYSGKTEETMSAVKAAHKKGAKIVGICGGGDLEVFCKKEKIPFYVFSYDSMPRGALGYLMTAALWVLAATKCIAFDLKKSAKWITELVSSMEEFRKNVDPRIPTEQNAAKYLAYVCYDRVPMIFGSGICTGVAKRFKTQFNENAKTFASYDIFPELNHNTAEGIQFPDRFREDCIVLMLENTFDHPQTKKRFDVFKKVLEKNDILYEVITANGDDIWTQKLCLILFGDYLTYYLAILNKVDPSPVTTIEWTKKQLKKK